MKMTCPHCGVIGSAHDSVPGAKVLCPQCDKVFKVMEEEIICPHCAVTGSAFGAQVGTKLRCPRCEKVFLLTQQLVTGPMVSDGIAVDMEEVVSSETAIVVESPALPEVEPKLMPESTEGSEPELPATPVEPPSVPEVVAEGVVEEVPEIVAEVASVRQFAGIQASPMAMESSVDMAEVVSSETAIVAESVALPEVEPELIPESTVGSEQELPAAPVDLPSVPEAAVEVPAEAASAHHFAGIQASPMAMESSVDMAEVVPTETAIVAESAALPEVEPELMPESTVGSEQELPAAPVERPSVPDVVAEMVADVAAEAASVHHFAGIQASPMAMDLSVDAVTELPEEVAAGVKIVREPQSEVEIPPVLEPVAELEPEPKPDSELELDPEFGQIQEVKAEKMVEPVVEVLPEPAMETVAQVVVEMIPAPVSESETEKTVEPLPEPELVSALTPEAEAVSSVAEEAAPGEMKEEELGEEGPAPTSQPPETCKGCGISFHPLLLQEVDGIRYCGVCQLRMAATTEKSARRGGERLRGILAAIILLGILALIAVLVMKFGIF